jgi:Flp pilus assembly protein TadB
MATVVILLVVAVIIVALVVLAVLRWRTEANARIRSQRVRAPDLEARIKTVLAGPRQKYGDIFTDYSVWKSEQETRLELTATDQWGRLNEFTRCLVVRYLWRVLESLAGGAVVVVDQPAQEWNVEVDAGFRDQGFDWKTFGHGPQFVEEP